MRQATVERNTKETQIMAKIALDGSGTYDVSTGIGFLDHMLEQLSRHSLMDLKVRAQGDLHIDFHHTTEDTGYVVGEALSKALGDRAGIVRYGSALTPMDETLTRVSLDCSNRPYLVWKVDFLRPKLGEMDTELFQEWFEGFRSVRRFDPACRNPVWREQPPHRRNRVSRAGARAERGDRNRSAQGRCRAVH